MCDYSLYSFENRLADEGEDLTLYKFDSGTLGFVSTSDLARTQIAKMQTGWWNHVTHWLQGKRATRLPAVCVPPGARLLLTGVPLQVQKSLGVGPDEVVVFAEISSESYSYRDALLLPNGTRVLLQDLPPGIHALVLTTSSEPIADPNELGVRAA